MTELTQEFFEKTLDKKLKDQKETITDEMASIVNAAFENHEKNFLQEQFDRLSDTASLSSQLHSLALDFKSLKEDVDSLKKKQKA